MSTAQAGRPRVLVRAGERGESGSSTHPYNPGSEIHGWTISRLAGLERLAVSLAWLPPGKESFAFHLHHREEEWLHVLEGRGEVEVDDAVHAVGPGDFLGFPPGVAHLVRAAPGERLTMLMGGEVITDVEVADFPRLRRRLARFGARFAVYPMEAEIPFLPGAAETGTPGTAAARPPPRVLVRAGERGLERAWRHPLDPAAEVHLTALSRPAGLVRVAVGVTRVPAGRASYVRHLHHHDEEWMFVLSGTGVAEVGEEAHAISPGDFLGFPAGGPAHNVRAAAGSDLAYLHGGDAWSRQAVEIVDYPTLGLRKTFVGTRDAATFPLEAALERRERGAWRPPV
jgi:uncharacterized cupin superfamily protein